MSDIRYVVLSDMHLGQDQSILTHIVDHPEGNAHTRLEVDPMASAPALTHMMEILAELIAGNQGEPPVLILLGDIVEMALTATHISTMVFERFARMWSHGENTLFSKVIYLAGNHDHHLWEFERGRAYAEYLAQASLDEPHQPTRHTTSLTRGLAGGGSLIHALVQRALGDQARALDIEAYYPNLALRSASGKRIALLHHGHFAESLYRLMSTLAGKLFPDQDPLPPDIETWECENFAWIEFFWSAMGRQGVVGSDVERIYDMLPDEKKLQQLSVQLAHTLIDEWHPGSWYTKVEKAALGKALPYLFRHLVSTFGHERSHSGPDQFPSQGLLDGLSAYIDGPLIHQVRSDLLGGDQGVPGDVTFIFGHTHQPFERVWDGSSLGAVKLYNTGGWAVDPSPSLQPHMGGAAVLLDDELNATSVRFFNQAEKPEDYRVSLRTADPQGNPLHERLASLIQPDKDPYASFSRSAAASIARRFAVVREVEDGVSSGANDSE